MTWLPLCATNRCPFTSPTTQPAVSQQLRTAERAFGTALVEADGRGLRLTRAGQLLADGAAEVATSLAKLQRALDALQGEPTGTVSIAALPSAAEFLLPGVLRRLRGSGIRLELTDEDVAEADFARRAADHDIVIGHSLSGRPAGAERVVAQVVALEPLDVAMPANHRLTGRRTLRAADLVGEDWIGVPLV